MKILITGSSGYVGNVLASYFAKKDIEVIGCDLDLMPRQKDLENFKFYKLNVTDKQAVSDLIKKETPTHVIHLAYLMDPQHDAEFERKVDVDGSMNIFHACNNTPSVKQLLLFSSTSAYGGHPDNPVGITEDTPLNPVDYVYGIHKKTVEEHYRKEQKRDDLKIPIVRMCTVVGPNYYKKGGVVATFSKAPVAMALDGRDTKLQWLHEDDLTALVDLILNDPEIDNTYNLVPDDHTTIKTMAKAHGKKVLNIPMWLFKSIISILWTLRLSSVSPPQVRLIKYGIAASAHKIKKRYNYVFKYNSLEAFNDAVDKRRQNGTL